MPLGVDPNGTHHEHAALGRGQRHPGSPEVGPDPRHQFEFRLAGLLRCQDDRDLGLPRMMRQRSSPLIRGSMRQHEIEDHQLRRAVLGTGRDRRGHRQRGRRRSPRAGAASRWLRREAPRRPIRGWAPWRAGFAVRSARPPSSGSSAPGHAEQTVNAVEDVPGAARPPSSTAAVHESALVPLAAGCPEASLG